MVWRNKRIVNLNHWCVFICNHHVSMLQENIVTLPNLLSLGRIGLSPALGYLIVSSHYTAALAIFAVAGISDLVSCSSSDKFLLMFCCYYWSSL